MYYSTFLIPTQESDKQDWYYKVKKQKKRAIYGGNQRNSMMRNSTIWASYIV